MNDLTNIPRGKPVRGARNLAVYILDDPLMAHAMYELDRAEFGIQIIANQLTGYANWLDAALARRASAGSKRWRRPRTSTSVGEAAGPE